jgi:thioredoxin reductase
VYYRLIEADHYRGKDVLIVGGGDSAFEAAMGLALQEGNRVTLSYRRSEFSRLKDRNAKRIQEHMQMGRIEVLFNSMPVEFRPGSVVIECSGETREVANDFVRIFAGGSAPTDFLKACGVEFGDPQMWAISLTQRSG